MKAILMYELAIKSQRRILRDEFKTICGVIEAAANRGEFFAYYPKEINPGHRRQLECDGFKFYPGTSFGMKITWDIQ